MDEFPSSLMFTALRAVVAELAADPATPEAWGRARRALGDQGEHEPDLALAIECEDAEALGVLVAGWESGELHLPELDRTVLKRAMKSFRKRIKLTRLDDESSIGGGAFSSGRESSIVAVTPPSQYETDVWEELVRQGRLRGGKRGQYELPPE